MKSTKETFAFPWKEVSTRWAQYYASPGRPSKQDCEIYETYVRTAVKNKKRVRALVLGMTPEVRNVLHKFPQIEVTCIDINLEMINAMNEFVSNSNKDTLMRGSWVSNPLESNYFDMVLGDLTWSNVPREYWNMLNKTLIRILKKEGWYIHRVFLIPKEWKFPRTQELVSEYISLPLTKQRHFELFIGLLINSFDFAKKNVSTSRIWKSLSKLPHATQENKKVGVLLERIHGFWGQTDKVWDTDFSDALQREMKKFFVIQKHVFAQDYLYAEACPVWTCRPRRK